MEQVCTCCGYPVLKEEDLRQTPDGPICESCGQIKDMILRAANDVIFEEWALADGVFR